MQPSMKLAKIVAPIHPMLDSNAKIITAKIGVDSCHRSKYIKNLLILKIIIKFYVYRYRCKIYVPNK